MNMAKLPMHRDLAYFDFSTSSADARLASGTPLLSLSTIADAKNQQAALGQFSISANRSAASSAVT
ncbi:hypothetical protein [Pseudomonas sp. GL-B-19]|uniref:hypothetical protein n=1 Tax=Pseudomonas sp. GL-B-19 TaxID=2832393 RepID=UPI0039891DEF